MGVFFPALERARSASAVAAVVRQFMRSWTPTQVRCIDVGEEGWIPFDALGRPYPVGNPRVVGWLLKGIRHKRAGIQRTGGRVPPPLIEMEVFLLKAASRMEMLLLIHRLQQRSLPAWRAAHRVQTQTRGQSAPRT